MTTTTPVTSDLDIGPRFELEDEILKELGCKENTIKRHLVLGACRWAWEFANAEIGRYSCTVEDLFRSRVKKQAIPLINQLQDASGKENDDNFWQHKNASGFAEMMKAQPQNRIDRDMVNYVVTQYILHNKDIRFKEFDLVAVDMLMAAEIFGIFCRIKADSGLVGALFVAKPFKDEMKRCFEVAVGAYSALSSPGVLSARHIQDMASDAQKRGVVWPGSLFALLDDVMARGGIL
jgi:hypothetical protein